MSVESLIADIAAVFHWPLSELIRMELAELIDWRRRAVAVWNRMNNPE
ncbi:MAG TPA: GpE family phage tail protein [Novosphingobium capsulatum]|nr:GpE family phage tail protein [Novosphingobium capsulatum]